MGEVGGGRFGAAGGGAASVRNVVDTCKRRRGWGSAHQLHAAATVLSGTLHEHCAQIVAPVGAGLEIAVCKPSNHRRVLV